MPERPTTSPTEIARGWLGLPHMLYPNEYVWFLMFSSMDVMLTWVILSVGGSEVNPAARFVIDQWGLPGAIAFKFSLILAVIFICEIIGRRNGTVARNVSQLAVVVSALPVLWSLALLTVHIYSLPYR